MKDRFDAVVELFDGARSFGAGLLAGLVAALFMSAVMALLRLLPGIPLPSEMGGDRFLAYISVDDFLSLIGQFGGPGGSKELALLATLHHRPQTRESPLAAAGRWAGRQPAHLQL